MENAMPSSRAEVPSPSMDVEAEMESGSDLSSDEDEMSMPSFNVGNLTPDEYQVLKHLMADAVGDTPELEKDYPRAVNLWRQYEAGKLQFCKSVKTPPSTPVRKNKRPLEEETRNDEEPFKYPPKRHTAPRAKIEIKIPRQVLNHKNSYKKLPEEQLNDESVPPVPPQPRIPKIKHITVRKTQNYRADIKLITNHEERKSEAKIGGEWIKIYPENETAHRNISRFVKEQDFEHFILPFGLTRPLKVVVRGLSVDYDPQDIADALTDEGYTILKVVQMTTRRDGKLLPLFQVQLAPEPEANKIYNIRLINNFRVAVEKYKSPFSAQQCHRCQFFHHHSDHCNVKPRCVKCGDPHSTNECPLGKEKIAEPRCCNCGGAHTANYRGCPKFPNNRTHLNRENQLNSRKSSSTGPGQQLSNDQGASYAGALRSSAPKPNGYRRVESAMHEAKSVTGQSQNSNEDPTTFAAQMREYRELAAEIKKELEINDFNELLQDMRNALALIKKCKNKAQKRSIIMDNPNLFKHLLS